MLVRVARGEDEPRQPVGVVRRHALRDRAARVVAHERDPGEVERRHEVGDDPREPGEAEVGVRPHRDRVRPEGQLGHDAAHVGVGTHRLVAPPNPFEPGIELFSFLPHDTFTG